MTKRQRRRAYYWGHVAEYCCMIRLWCAGYGILARRDRGFLGEIDLIARRGRTLCFIEVKARKDAALGLAAVSPAKRRRIQQGALLYLARHPCYADHGLRFDVMVVTSPFAIHHLKGAWSI